MSKHLCRYGLRGARHLLPTCIAAGIAASAGCTTTPGTTQPVIKSMTVNGARLSYQEQGSGEPVVFVHGAASDYRSWANSREPIGAIYRFVALTQRYFGPDPWPDKGENYSVETHAEDLATFVRQLGAGPVHLVGWSYGGAVQFMMAAKHPELVRSIFSFEPHTPAVVTEPADVKASSEDIGAVFDPVVRHSRAGDQVAATVAMIDAVNSEPGIFSRLPPLARAAVQDSARTMPLALAAPIETPTCVQLARIEKPVTVVYGEDTRTWFKVHARAASRCVPSAKLVVVPRARHLLPGQDPATFNALLLRHLQEQR